MNDLTNEQCFLLGCTAMAVFFIVLHIMEIRSRAYRERQELARLRQESHKNVIAEGMGVTLKDAQASPDGIKRAIHLFTEKMKKDCEFICDKHGKRDITEMGIRLERMLDSRKVIQHLESLLKQLPKEEIKP